MGILNYPLSVFSSNLSSMWLECCKHKRYPSTTITVVRGPRAIHTHFFHIGFGLLNNKCRFHRSPSDVPWLVYSKPHYVITLLLLDRLTIGLSISLGLFAIELIGFFGGISMFMPTQGLLCILSKIAQYCLVQQTVGYPTCDHFF